MGHSLQQAFYNGTFEIGMGHSCHVALHPNLCLYIESSENLMKILKSYF